MSPSPAIVAALMGVSLLAGLTKGVTGFGGALVMAPLFGLALPAPQAAALIVLVNCMAALQGWRRWSALVHWRAVVPLAAIALACTALVLQLLAMGNVPDLHRAIGLSVLAVTALHIAGWRWQHSGGTAPTLAAGLVSGAMTALCGIGGVAAVYYFNGMKAPAQDDAVTVLRANLLGYFALLFGGAALILAIDGQVGWPQLGTTALLVPAFMAGVVLGERIYGWLPRLWFDRCVSGLLLCAGVAAMVG